MKVGLMISFFDFRNDMRKVIDEILLHNDVVIFINSEHKKEVMETAPAACEIRVINERKSTLVNSLWEYFYLICKKIPVSKHNYFLMEAFKISNRNFTRFKKLKAQCILSLQKITAGFITYDAYINNLRFSAKTQIDDIGIFICTTEILNDYMFARIKKLNKDVRIYVYSWDHVCKQTKFSKAVAYNTWNASLAQDLIKLQDVEAEKVFVAGSSQLAYIYDYKLQEKKYIPTKKYIYFGCAIGIQKLVPYEINIIVALASALKAIYPDWILLVRPYPVLSDWQAYDTLAGNENIELDNDFRASNLSVTDDDIFDKYEKLDQAEAFFHLGTTMGLEACFFNTPSFIVDFGYDTKKGVSLYNFIHQYQNEKYLIKPFPFNVVSSIAHFKEILLNINDPKFLEPNREIPKQYNLVSFNDFAKKLMT